MAWNPLTGLKSVDGLESERQRDGSLRLGDAIHAGFLKDVEQLLGGFTLDSKTAKISDRKAIEQVFHALGRRVHRQRGRSLLSSCQDDLAKLLGEVKEALEVPIAGVVSDGQTSIRKAAAKALKGVPHQLCHFHYLREAALPVYEADRHAKGQLKKKVRGIRPIERKVEGREGAEAEAIRYTHLYKRIRPPICLMLSIRKKEKKDKELNT